jgi:hypothetical protein
LECHAASALEARHEGRVRAILPPATALHQVEPLLARREFVEVRARWYVAALPFRHHLRGANFYMG